MEAGDGTDAEGMYCGDRLSERAVGLEQHSEGETDGDEEECAHGAGDAIDRVVAAVARAGDEGTLDDGEGEAGVGDFVERAAGGREGEKREVEGE